MSSIGILTYFNYYNYGSMLQGYATQVALRKFLCDTDTCKLINYRHVSAISTSKVSLLKLRIKRSGHYITNFKQVITKSRYASRLSRKNVLFDEFRNSYIDTTSEFYRNKQDLISNPPKFDTYVIGSDQTWSPIVSGGYSQTPMFFDYISDKSHKCAYAPSLGTTNFSTSDKKILETQVNKFEILSCRESSGAELIRSLTSKKVTKVLDPTLLLTANEWRKIAILPQLPTSEYILCYFIGNKDYYRKFAKRLSEQLKLPVFFIPVSWKDCKKDNTLLFDVGPREFVGLIDNATVVLTDSFHGTAFSVNLNTDFYSFVKHSGGKDASDNSRLFDFLHGLGLDARLCEQYDDNDIDFSQIDFSPVNEILEKERIKSYEVIESIAKI